MLNLEYLKNASLIEQGGFVAIIGLIGVFAVLLLIFLLVRLFGALDRNKTEQEPDD